MERSAGRLATSLLVLLGIWALFGLPAPVSAAPVILVWDPNPEADLAGYKVHIGTSAGTYTQAINVGRVTTYSVSDLSPGETYYFAVSAYDIIANESGFSEEVSISIPLAPTTTHSVSVSTTAALPGTYVTVTVEGAKNDLDWVGVYSTSSPDEDGWFAYLIDYQYIHGRTTLTFTLPTADDTYHYRLYEKHSVRLLATSPNIVVTTTGGF
jgi:hypothetical protein